MSITNTNEEKRLISCLNCGNTFEFDKRKSNRRFCNEDCRCSFYGYTSHKPKVEKKTTYLIRKCKFCGKEFECKTAAEDRSFCSDDCKKIFIQKQQEESKIRKESREKRKCLFCGKEFIWKTWNQKHCSKECSDKFNEKQTHRDLRSENRTCAYCGSKFTWCSNKPSQKYCCYECQREATKKNLKERSKLREKPEDLLRTDVYFKVLEIINKMYESKGNTFDGKYIDYWKIGDISEKTREKVLERDGFECKICKRKDSLHLHHLIKRKNGGEHTLENLITLCASCHRHIETGDVEHATNACYRNARRNYAEAEQIKTVDIEFIKNKLTLFFDKLKESEASTNTEIMVCLDEVLDYIGN